ncbi:MAG: dynamin family protein [Muribaculaceae bacterium]|nr:dynamin family protein [Muribaculaceae bacterium]
MAKKSSTQRTAKTKQTARLAKQKENSDIITDKFQDQMLGPDKESDLSTENSGVDVMANSVDVYQLKKRIKELEGELEDAEDDLANAEKKLKKKVSEFSELDQKFEKQIQELNAKAKEIADIREDLRLKMKSLGFVQEILLAKVSETQDMVRLNRDIDLFESFVKGQFVDLLSTVPTVGKLDSHQKCSQKELDEMKDRWTFAFDQWAATKRKSWLDGKTSIAFVGEFSAGKTSIVNRILSQDDPNAPQLPVSTEATTAIPTYIAGGRRSSYTFISNDKRKTIAASTFKSVSKQLLDQVHGVTSLIKYFVMTYKNANLDGLSILDTPGFNSNDPEDAERTIEVINECDALFWVFDVNVGEINKTSIQLIKNKLQKPLYVVINKVDTKSKTDVTKEVRHIKNTLKREGINIEGIIPFSRDAPVEDIMRAIKSVTRNSARDTFVQDLKSSIEQLIVILKSQHKDLNNAVIAQDRSNDQLDNQIIKCINKMVDECFEACNIPHWETHFFSSDRYEMSRYEGKQLQNILNRVSGTRVKRLRSLLKERIETAHNFQQAYSDLCDAKDALKKVTECFNEFKKVSRRFN